MANDKKKKNIAVIGGWGSAPYTGDKSRPLDEVYGVSNERGGGFLTRKGEKDIYGSNAKPLSQALVVGTASDTKFENSKNNPVRKAQYNRGYVPWVIEKIKESKSPADFRRKASGTYTEPYDVKEPSKKEDSKPAKAASDKSRVASKMTNYQRMQAKQLEKEGYAGRSLTRAQAQKMAGAKSASNTSSLMSLFGISKKKTETPKAMTPKKLTSDFAKKNLAANQKIGKSK